MPYSRNAVQCRPTTPGTTCRTRQRYADEKPPASPARPLEGIEAYWRMLRNLQQLEIVNLWQDENPVVSNSNPWPLLLPPSVVR